MAQSSQGNPFKGRITHQHHAHAEFTGRPPVLIPDSSDDVVAALEAATACGRTIHIRSGEAINTGDMVTDPDAAVLSLEALKSIDIDLQRIRVGPATTVGELATALRHRALFLPLPDDPSQSLASAVLGDRRLAFPKSVSRRWPLWRGVVEAVVVSLEGEVNTLDAAQWRRFRRNPSGAITSLVFDAARWSKYGRNRWLGVWMMPYTSATFGLLCKQLFVRPLRGVDLTLRASSGAYGARLIIIRATGQDHIIRATGQDKKLSDRTRHFVERALFTAHANLLWSDILHGSGATLGGWVGSGLGRPAAGEVLDHMESDARWSSDETGFIAEVDDLLARGAWVELHAGSLMRRAMLPAAAGVLLASLVRSASKVRMGWATPGATTALAPTHTQGPIPGFDGEVFLRSTGDRAYRKSIEQYAVSSFPEAVVRARMTPFLVCYPENSASVVSAVAWAAQQNKKVVARSGGHQYCGLSSGGDDTVLIDLKHLAGVTFNAAKTRVTVRPSTALMDLSKALVGAHVSIPHGECPLVRLGGHTQTGGVGHQTRELGLTLDWVREFTMVTGGPGGWKERTYPIPTANPAPTDGVFAAVLGGGPGSFGVITSITFEVVHDSTYPESGGITRAFPYNRSGWAEAFEQVRLWSKAVHAGELRSDIDLFVSVVSSEVELLPHSTLRPATLLIETSALTAEGFPIIQAAINAIAGEVSWLDRQTGKVMDLTLNSPDGPTPLSVLIDDGVRSVGVLGGMPEGREFSLPYKKSVYVTRVPMPPEFCARFVDLVDRVNRHDKTKVVFQNVIGGGKFAQNTGPTTAMQQRDALVQIVFDVFHEEGYEAVAEAFQAEMLALWNRYLPGETKRMFWGTYEDAGTHGAQLDMNNPDTRARFYDSPARYAALQKVKAQVDPADVFHTTFTVKTP